MLKLRIPNSRCNSECLSTADLSSQSSRDSRQEYGLKAWSLDWLDQPGCVLVNVDSVEVQEEE